MTCPYCNSTLQETEVGLKNGDLVKLHECFVCGGHWLPHLTANELTLDTAKNLDAILTAKETVPPDQPRCPICNTRLSAIKTEAVAQGVMVWTCPNTHGNFFPKGELFKFKKAQEAKISYHQIWGIPLRSVLAVMLPVLVVLSIAAGLPLTVQQLQKNQESRTKAGSTFTSPVTTKLSDTSILISFSTLSPAKTSLSLYEDGQFRNTIPISTVSKTLHTTTLKDLSPSHTYTYTLTLIFDNDQIETSSQIFLDLSNSRKSP